MSYTQIQAHLRVLFSPPFLFSLYTADCRSARDSCIVDKYADDTCLMGLIVNDNDTDYVHEINSFVDWCDNNFLQLNVGKTKEMVIDFRKGSVVPPPVVIKGNEVERVQSYKYLGVTFNNELSWSENTDLIMKKVNTRMYCLRKLKSFDVSSQLLQIFFNSIVGSILTFGLTCWGGNLTQADRARMDRVVTKAEKLVGKSLDNLEILYNKRVLTKVKAIMKDDSHPLKPDFDRANVSGSGRLQLPKCKTNRFKNSFFPIAIKKYNEGYKRASREM